MGDVLGNGQLAPHGGILAPVVVVTDKDDLLIVGVVLGVGTRPDDVVTGIVQNGDGVAAVALNNLVDPGGLGNGRTGQEVQQLQGVLGLPGVVDGGLDDAGSVILSHDLGDVGAIGGTGAIADLHADVKGALDVVGGDRGAVGPLGGGLDLHGQLGLVGVPLIVAVSQQAGQLAVQRVVHVQGLEHDRAVTGSGAGNGHGVVLVCTDDVPAVDGAPLLAGKVQGLSTGQVAAGGGLRRRGLGGLSGLVRRVGGLGVSRGCVGRGGGGVVLVPASSQQAQGHHKCKQQGQGLFLH